MPERLRGAFTTRRYTNPRLPLPNRSTELAVSSLTVAVNIASTYSICLLTQNVRLSGWLNVNMVRTRLELANGHPSQY